MTDLSAAEDRASLERSSGFARAAAGFIIPSGNRLIERQFARFAPNGFAAHAARLRMNGQHKKGLAQLLDAVAQSAETVADAGVDLIGFHCTANAMEHGPDGEARIREAITKATGLPALSTGQAICDALRAVGIRRLMLVTPYVQATNDHERDYLAAEGFAVVKDVALGSLWAERPAYHEISPARWLDITRAAMRDDADGFLLSCANTTQIDTIVPLEAEFGKPAINSNQAMLWAALRLVQVKLPPFAIPAFGALMNAKTY